MRIDRSFVAGAIVGGTVVLALAGTAPAAAPQPLRSVAVTLHRFDTVPGRKAAFADWMTMLQRRHREAVATLAREQTYLEAMFTAPDELRRLYWLTVAGAGGATVESSTNDLDRRHEAFMATVLAKGSHTRLVKRNVLAPDFMVAAVRREQERTVRRKLVIALLLAGPAQANSGDLLAQQPVGPPLAFADWFRRVFSKSDMSLDPPADLARNAAYYTPSPSDAFVRQNDVIGSRIAYDSDGLRIAGFLARPRRTAGGLPAIL